MVIHSMEDFPLEQSRDDTPHSMSAVLTFLHFVLVSCTNHFVLIRIRLYISSEPQNSHTGRTHLVVDAQSRQVMIFQVANYNRWLVTWGWLVTGDTLKPWSVSMVRTLPGVSTGQPASHSKRVFAPTTVNGGSF